jgi:hypothetical protein
MQVEREPLDSSGGESGERVSNTQVTCLEDGDNYWKRWLIPDVLGDSVRRVKRPSRGWRFEMGLWPIS